MAGSTGEVTPDVPAPPGLPGPPSTGRVDVDALVEFVDTREFSEARHVGKALDERRVETAKRIVLGDEVSQVLAAVGEDPVELAKLAGSAAASVLYAVLAGEVTFKDGRDAASFIKSAGELSELLSGRATTRTESLSQDEIRDRLAELKAKAINTTSKEST